MGYGGVEWSGVEWGVVEWSGVVGVGSVEWCGVVWCGYGDVVKIRLTRYTAVSYLIKSVISGQRHEVVSIKRWSVLCDRY